MKSNRLFALLAGLGLVVGIKAQNTVINDKVTGNPTERGF